MTSGENSKWFDCFSQGSIGRRRPPAGSPYLSAYAFLLRNKIEIVSAVFVHQNIYRLKACKTRLVFQNEKFSLQQVFLSATYLKKAFYKPEDFSLSARNLSYLKNTELINGRGS